MKALVWDGKLRLERDYPKPQPAPGEALIRVLCAGICNTDLELIKGYLGFRGVLGHEFVGRVEAAPDPAWVGQRVVGEINAACFACPTCLSGVPSQCPNRTTLGIDRRDGAFAEYLTLPQTCLHRVPDSLPDDVAVFTEPLAAALEIPTQVHIRPIDRLAVIGDGKLGLLVAQALALSGAELVALGRHAEKLDLLQRQGIATQVLGRSGDTREIPTGLDIVVECTGNPDGCDLARRMVRPRGTIALKSTYHGLSQMDLTQVVVDEIRLIGSRCGPFAPALRLLQSGRIQVEPLIQARYSLDEAVMALKRAAEPGMLKVLLDVG